MLTVELLIGQLLWRIGKVGIERRLLLCIIKNIYELSTWMKIGILLGQLSIKTLSTIALSPSTRYASMLRLQFIDGWF